MKIIKPEWDRRFMAVARQGAGWTKDRSPRGGVGCVVVGPYQEIRATGYNGFPRGVDDNVEERHQRPAKYLWPEHAERNAIFNAARTGTALDGCTLYVNLHPCADCARAIIQTGIKLVVCTAPQLDDAVWGEQFRTAQTMLREAAVDVLYGESLPS